jgi:DNA mismatch endonuclease (patch repair protein)
MTDPLSKADRAALMSRIRSKNTGPELIVRSCVHRLGYRFRLHDRTLPGSPDLVFKRLKSVVLVHGCFWHRHPRCRYAYTPKSRQEFWTAKFQANVVRDRRTVKQLRLMGWRVLIVWECQTHDAKRLETRLANFLGK